MRVERGASQILFGLLPEQTADFEARVWRVRRWVDPVALVLDQDALRTELLRSIAPWANRDLDNGMSDELYRRTPVEVVGVNRERGVVVDPFPRLWRCRRCNRVRRSDDACVCGSTRLSQLHYVAYHSCGAVDEPLLPTCREHNEVAIHLPGTSSASEIAFSCPVCGAGLGSGLIRRRCPCGQDVMSVTVHRASVVYTPRFTVLVNPPDPAEAARIRGAGGGARALEWVLDGMQEAGPTEGRQTVSGLIDTLLRQGISESTARELARHAEERGEVSEGRGVEIDLPDDRRQPAQEDALALGHAVAGGRTRIADMVSSASPALRTLYEGDYGQWLTAAGLEEVELLPAFPVATVAYGYTRGGVQPGESALVPFRERGALRVYGALNQTEGLLFRLDPLVVYGWLRRRGLALPEAETRRSARTAILERLELPSPVDEHPQAFGEAVLGLVHSYCHRAVRTLAAFAGIERDSLAEYLIPRHLAFVIYAASRGDFVLGGLQAVFESMLHHFLSDFVNGESRCPLDPGCRAGGGACMACLHLGEPSCRWFNRFLNRDYLFGPTGYVR